jgi:Condensation domain/Phosphopantetheine attachment site/AMP-binding enzyme C-terminal domain
LRIELEEIEAVIAQAPGVRTTAVLVRQDAPNPQLLVGYVSPAGLDTKIIQQFAGARLPAYMVPQVWMTLDNLPLNINGKIDRKALPKPDYAAGREIVAPRNAAEQSIAEIWAEILGLPLDKIGVTVSFFVLGGHSLLATQVVARINARMGIDLNVRAMFEHPSIAEFATHANAAPPATAGIKQEIITPAPRQEVSGLVLMPTSFAQERMWVTVQLNTAQSLYNSSFIVKTKGTPYIDKLHAALQALVMRHEVLRTSIANVEGKPTQVIHMKVTVPFTVTPIPAGSESKIHRLLDEERAQPFDLMHDVLLRCSVFMLASGECYVLFCMHHIVTDGWSLGLFLNEVNALYHNRPLPPLSIQYADFAVWHRNFISSQIYEKQKQYWMQKLGGELPTLDLPLDRPRPKIMSHAGGVTLIRVNTPLASSIRALALAHQCTTYVVLLAAFQTLLHRYTGLEDIIVGTTFANRNNKQLEELIGFFVNTVAMRTDFSGTPTFAEVLRRARTTALEAYEHQDMPFEENVNNLRIVRSLSTSPIFQVMLTYQNNAFSQKKFCGQEFDTVEENTVMSKFDMTLAVEDGEAEMDLSLTYALDLFNATTAQRMLGHLVCLLQSICAKPELPLAQLSMMDDAERNMIVKQWNNTAAPYPR